MTVESRRSPVPGLAPGYRDGRHFGATASEGGLAGEHAPPSAAEGDLAGESASPSAAESFRIDGLETMYIPGWRPACFNYWGRALPR